MSWNLNFYTEKDCYKYIDELKKTRQLDYDYEIEIPPLFFALRNKYNLLINLLLDNGANINVIYNDKTPLMLACHYEQTQLVELLLQRGANININRKFDTALTIACSKYNIEIIQLLLRYKRDEQIFFITYFDKNDTILHYFCKRRHRNLGLTIDIIKLLFENGANEYINLQNKNGDTPLHELSRIYKKNEHFRDLPDDNIMFIEISKLLLKFGAHPSIVIKNNKQETPIHIGSFFFEHLNVIELFIKYAIFNELDISEIIFSLPRNNINYFRNISLLYLYYKYNNLDEIEPRLLRQLLLDEEENKDKIRLMFEIKISQIERLIISDKYKEDRKGPLLYVSSTKNHTSITTSKIKLFLKVVGRTPKGKAWLMHILSFLSKKNILLLEFPIDLFY